MCWKASNPGAASWSIAVKLTKKDPAAGGRHHVINLELISAVQDGKVVLSMPAAEAQASEKPLEG